jgi:hypothetical protein
MKKSAILMFLFMAVLLANGCRKKTGAQDQLQVDNNLTPEINIGTVNDVAVSVRDHPSLLDAVIVGQLDKGTTVSVIGRLQNRFGVQDSFWLKIRNDNIEGWVYGAYIDIKNLTNDQYDLLPVIFIYTESGFIYTENGSFYPDVINGVWENRKDIRFFSRSMFSWGVQVRSSTSVLIDLNSNGRNGPYFYVVDHGAVFSVQEKELRGNQVILTCYLTDEPNERVEIIVTIIDENTISIDLVGWDNDRWLFPSPSDRDLNPNRYYYRVPYDAPYEPLIPGEDL